MHRLNILWAGRRKYITIALFCALITAIVSILLLANKSDKISEKPISHKVTQQKQKNPDTPETDQNAAEQIATNTDNSQPDVNTQPNKATSNQKPAAKPQPTTPVRDNSTTLPATTIPKGITIGFVNKPNMNYIHYQVHGYTATKYLFVVTPVKTATPHGTFITENFLEEITSQNGMGNPDFPVGTYSDDIYTVAVCGAGGYLTCGTPLSNKVRMVVFSTCEYGSCQLSARYE
jgi:hypothetical protein